jgi:hypothetical protein
MTTTVLKYACCFRRRSHAPSTVQPGDTAKSLDASPSELHRPRLYSREDSDFSEARREIHRIFQSAQESTHPKRKGLIERLKNFGERAIPTTLRRKCAAESSEVDRYQRRKYDRRQKPRVESHPFRSGSLPAKRGLWSGNYARSSAYDLDAYTIGSSLLSRRSCRPAAPQNSTDVTSDTSLKQNTTVSIHEPDVFRSITSKNAPAKR